MAVESPHVHHRLVFFFVIGHQAFIFARQGPSKLQVQLVGLRIILLCNGLGCCNEDRAGELEHPREVVDLCHSLEIVLHFASCWVLESVYFLVSHALWLLLIQWRKGVKAELIFRLLALVSSLHFARLLDFIAERIENRTFSREALTEADDDQLLKQLFLIL